MAEEGGAEDAAPVTGLDAVVVPHLEYHAVPVLLLTDEDDMTEDDVRDKLRVCFEESEDLKVKEISLKVVTKNDLAQLVDENEDTPPAFAKLVERQIERDVAALELELREKAEAEYLEREAERKAKEEEEAAAAAEAEEAKDGEAAETEEPDQDANLADQDDQAEPEAEKAEEPEEPEPEPVRKTCIYLCKYDLTEEEMAASSRQSLRYPLCALAYIHSKLEGEGDAEASLPSVAAPEKEKTESDKLFIELKKSRKRDGPVSWAQDVALLECEAVDQGSYENLKTKLLKVSSCSATLKRWQDSTPFISVPDAAECRLGYYRQLADSVPPPSCSVPVLLHCMLEQVEQNAESGVMASPEKTMADTCSDLFDSIIGGMEDGPAPAERGGVEVVFELSQTLKGSPRKGARRGGQQRPLGTLVDVKEVEGQMCALSGVPGTRGFEVEGREEVSEEERATRVTSKEYFCQKHGLALVALEHFEQLTEAVGCLPKEFQDAHGDNLMSRRHVELLDSASAAQSILHTSSVLPRLSSKHLELEDATLVVLSAEAEADCEPPALPLPVRLNNVYTGEDADQEKWPGYVYDIAVKSEEIMKKFTSVDTYPCEGSRLCSLPNDTWTLHQGMNTLHYGGAKLAGTTSDGSSVLVTEDCTQVALEEGVVLSANKDGTASFTHVGEQEACWTVLHTGAVVKCGFDQGGRKMVLLPDGCIGTYDPKEESWSRVNVKGERWSERPAPEEPVAEPAEGEDDAAEAVEEPAAAEEEEEEVAAAAEEDGEKAAEEGSNPDGAEGKPEDEDEDPKLERTYLPTLSVARVRDPDTGALVLTREDLTMMIQYEEGHKLTLFSDGTRIITYASGEWETMLQLKSVTLLFKGDQSKICIGRLEVETTDQEGVKVRVPFDASTLEVRRDDGAATVTLGEFTAEVGSGALRLGEEVLWGTVAAAAEAEPAPAEVAEEAEGDGSEPQAEAESPGDDKAEDAEPVAEEEPAAAEGGDAEEGDEEEESGLQRSATFKARVFKVYKDGEAVEFIDESTFQSIKAKAESRGDQHISETDINNSETATKPMSHTFLSESDVMGSKGIVVAHNIAGESQAPRALQTLTVPSAITFAYVGSHSVPLPMISAIPADDTTSEASKTLLVRQVQEFPKVEDAEVESVKEVLRDLDDFDLVNEDTSPTTYLVSEAELGSSNAEIKRQILETSEKIKRLREAKQASQGQWPLNTLKAPSSQEKSPSPSKSGNILKEESFHIRERPKEGTRLPYFGSEEAKAIRQKEVVRKNNPSNKPKPEKEGEMKKKYSVSDINYGSIQKLDNTLNAIFRHSYGNLGIIASALGMLEGECPKHEKEEEWREMAKAAKEVCEGGSQLPRESVQTQIRKHFIASNIGVGQAVLSSCLEVTKTQRYLELFADLDSTSRVDTALEALCEILNYDFRYLADLLTNFRQTRLPAGDKEVAQAVANASKTCSSVAEDDSVEAVFKHLRSDFLLAGPAGAAALDDLLDCLNLEKKKKEILQVFVEEDGDDDGYLTEAQFKSLVPRLNVMLLSPDIIQPEEISDTFEGKVSIADCIDFLLQKQTQNSPMFPGELSSEVTNFTAYNSRPSMDNEFWSYKDMMKEYDAVRVSSNKVAPCVMNAEYLSVEGETRRTLKTGLCSMQKLKLQEGMAVKNFQLEPAYIFLGRLEPGATAMGTFSLQNIGPEAARFNVGNVEPPFELDYKPGLLAAGMKRAIGVMVKIPEDSTQTCFSTEVVIKTECNILYCTVVAKLKETPKPIE